MTPFSIARPLARRIDRLSRRAHAFHRHAHHPLCEPYRDEVIRIGKRTRLCKGCTHAAVGLFAGTVAGIALAPKPLWGALAIALALGLGAMSLRRRLPKMLGRLVPGAGLALALWSGMPVAPFAVLILAALVFFYRRRGVERRRCEVCHERRRNPCSGFALVFRRERAFQRRANSWLRSPPRSMA